VESARQIVDTAKLRWRIERDYHELKQEVGLGHFEGRGWRGFHHHATLCIAAYGFLLSERAMISPSGPRSTWPFNNTAKFERCSRRHAVTLPLLRRATCRATYTSKIVTQ
jgi:Transposase DDE domain